MPWRRFAPGFAVPARALEYLRRGLRLMAMVRVCISSLLLLCSACGSYTYVSLVHRDPHGGTLAVRPDDRSREEAARRMEAHCRGSFVVVDETRVVVGQRTTTEVTETGESTRVKDIHELQISYACRPASPTELGYRFSRPSTPL